MHTRQARSGEGLDILLALEAVLPCPGGAERFALELLSALGDRHRVRALALGEPHLVAPLAAHAPGVDLIAASPPAHGRDGAWRRRCQRNGHMRQVVRELLADEPADVVIGQLNTGPGTLAGARDAGARGVLLLAGYEALCTYAFAPGSQCRPASRCSACPIALDLPDPERRALMEMRAAQDVALASAACLVAPSHAMSAACARITGRGPGVAAPVVGAPVPAAARRTGHIVLVSSVWSRAKGVELLAPIARSLPHRSVLVAAPNGLSDAHRPAVAALPNVTVWEAASEIGALLEGAAMLLVPSQHPEPFGRVAFEAMAAGVPTLASATGGLTEFVPAEQLVAEFEDPDAWASAVRALEGRRAWGEARRRSVAAGARVLASDPPRRIERWLQRTATTADRASAAAITDAGQVTVAVAPTNRQLRR